MQSFSADKNEVIIHIKMAKESLKMAERELDADYLGVL